MDKIQVIKCKCGEVFSACREPECWTDDEYQKDLRKYVADGCTVEMVETFKFGTCKCVEVPTVKPDPNQLQLEI